MMATTNITFTHWHLYGAIKVFAAIMLLRWERKYIDLRWHQYISRFLFHLSFGPEWGLLKGIVAIPVWLFWGSRLGNAFFYRFMPIKTGRDCAARTLNCPVCKDTGIVGKSWRNCGRQCSCKVSQQWLDELTR